MAADTAPSRTNADAPKDCPRPAEHLAWIVVPHEEVLSMRLPILPLAFASATLAVLAAAGIDAAATQTAHAASGPSSVRQAPHPGWRGPGYGYDVANSAYFHGGGIKTTPILDIDKLEDRGLLRTQPSSDFDQSITVGSNLSEYSRSLTTSVGVSGGIGAFRASVRTSFGSFSSVSTETAFITNNAVARKRQYWIEGGSRIRNLTPYLMPEFKEDVNDPKVEPEELFRTYGTHLLHNVGFGGVLSMNYRHNNISNASTRSLSIEAQAAYGAISGSTSTSDERRSRNLVSNSEISIRSSGGTNSIDVTSIDAAKASFTTWQGSIDPDNSKSLAFVGGPAANAALDTWAWPIWDFADSRARRREIEDRFDAALRANASYFKTLQEPPTYVQEIHVAAAKSATAAEAQLRQRLGSGDFVMYPAPWDLNRRAGGSFIYLGYTTTTDPSEAVTDVVITSGKNGNHYARAGVRYRPTNVDLNQGAGGAYLWLLSTRNPAAAAQRGKVVRSLGVQINNDKTANIGVGPGWTIEATDLNRGAGGAHIYLWSQLQAPNPLAEAQNRNIRRRP
ncbi:MAC/perforin domain-containing protein [Conexibacter sp. JD483]|uniref:MAC/perforin domain-containing protein n=1 Tax=unclassified Conexibacter TaxID=2627773 RepID=UPI00271FF023|nr:MULTISPECIES: MAC/perforin domain-containing protein [unclassified Conexibacter]MDO8189548.1 MAC/perforin domain-containing protein [Conexibacter sp. CPCC 205706]MDO8202108.1 MAC/perforin domain-containing protein [Conexibacter sp. CPCC 205762]MDR9372916.1 MAC/perforin domain-containing protein [Conexibacter sp. JD483]